MDQKQDNSLPCIVRISKHELIVCNSCDLEPLDLLNGLALSCCQSSHKVEFICMIRSNRRRVGCTVINCGTEDLNAKVITHP